ncbi:MAG: hypothetical protein KDC90_17390, partial [Ignavibacteriae bacterium]|nr:hypothetical protein [Ignavibacteriota bacterium]
MLSKTIPITCTASHFVEIQKMHAIHGNLRSRTSEHFSKLRSLILKHGFSFPIYLWFDGTEYYTLDGHGRDYTCQQLVEEGYLFQHKDGEINSKLPSVLIDAKHKKKAKEKLLAVNSSFGTITEEEHYSFIFEPDYELNLEIQ